jgi:hypothetical protein
MAFTNIEQGINEDITSHIQHFKVIYTNFVGHVY